MQSSLLRFTASAAKFQAHAVWLKLEGCTIIELLKTEAQKNKFTNKPVSK